MIQLKENNGIPRSLLLTMAVIAGLTVANCYYNQPVCLMASPWASPRARRAEDVAPYHGVRTTGRHHVRVVGADVPGGPRA